jgi:LacI family gluconate utilization system Gnt-I transcriptional repressor
MQMGADMLDACSPPIRLVMLFFAAMTTLAIGAIARCQQRGIALPAQLAIGGFNDLQPAAWTTRH